MSKPDDLDLLKPWARRFDAIQFTSAWRSRRSDGELEQEIEGSYLECGCRAGRITLVVAVLVAATIALLARPLPAWPPEYWIIAGSAIALPPLTAMLIAIVRARLRLAAMIRELQQGQP